MKFLKTAVVTVISTGAGFYLGRRTQDETIEFSQSQLQCQESTNCVSVGTKSADSGTSLFKPFVFPPIQAKSDLAVINIPPAASGPVSNVGQLVKYGIPATDSLRNYDDFILSYDRRNRTAHWVLEHLTPEKVTKVDGVDRGNMKFKEDESFHSYHRATNKDYAGSGYDRGHLAAAANHRQSEKAMNQTFILSNVSPQVGEGFNRGAWNNLEKYVRGIARNVPNTYVCSGPLYLPRKESDGKLYVKYEVIGDNNVAVPTHFFKIVVIENKKGQLELLSYVMPNQPLPETKMSNYLVPIEAIERASGLNFFQNIPDGTFKRINGS